MLEPADADLLSAVESILLVHGEPVTISALAAAIGVPRGRILAALQALQESLRRGIRLQLHDGRAQLVTAPENSEVVQRFLGAARPAPLSRAALETLAIVAYHQPVTRAEIETARGVNSDRAVLTLLARDLIAEAGRRETVGRPHEFGTTFAFLEYFGLTSLQELPALDNQQAGPLSPRGFGLRQAQGESAP